MRLALTATLVLMLAVLSGPTYALSANLVQAETVAETAPSVLLEGVIVGSLPATSIALIRKQGLNRARPVSVGETVYGMTLIEVSEQEAVFEWNGSYLNLWLDGGAAVRPAQRAGADATTDEKVSVPEDSRDGEAKRKASTAPREWLVRKLERESTEARLKKEMAVILAETGIVPRHENEKAQGLEIKHLPDGTVLSELGLLPGDVVLSVNEVSLESLHSLNGLLPRLRTENEVLVVVERRGRILNLAYELNP
jgi:type II secretion system protein C